MTYELLSPPRYGAAIHYGISETQLSLCGKNTEFWYIRGNSETVAVNCKRCLKAFAEREKK